jgi:hypothetical protein
MRHDAAARAAPSTAKVSVFLCLERSDVAVVGAERRIECRPPYGAQYSGAMEPDVLEVPLTHRRKLKNRPPLGAPGDISHPQALQAGRQAGARRISGFAVHRSPHARTRTEDWIHRLVPFLISHWSGPCEHLTSRRQEAPPARSPARRFCRALSALLPSTRWDLSTGHLCWKPGFGFRVQPGQ